MREAILIIVGGLLAALILLTWGDLRETVRGGGLAAELAVEQERRLMDAAVWYDRESGYIREVEALKAELTQGYTFEAKVGIWLNNDTALALTDASLFCSSVRLTPLGDAQIYDIPQETP